VPLELLDSGAMPNIPNIPNARYWGDEPPPNLSDLAAELAEQRRISGMDNNTTFLALSGGSDNGAFGAGLLNAWTEMGTRPEFTVVTGVSTGALSAPFVFLGPDYDDELQMMYGGFPQKRIFRLRGWLSILPQASIADTEPLAEVIAQLVDEKLLAEVAREHRRGRRLLVQTSHLDAQRAVIWDLGAIAASGAPNAIDVFRKALIASASIPVAFPPVLFKVEIDGQVYDEMHVDGGVVSQATTLTSWQEAIKNEISHQPGGPKTLKIYVVRNGRIAPEAQAVEYGLLGIAGRSIATLIKSQGIGDLLSAYAAAQIRGGDYYLTWIGEDFVYEYPGPFDPAYMSALSDYGYNLMKSGNAWVRKPPVLMDEAERAAMERTAALPASGQTEAATQ
jgi:predicted patatin/cPLA2 family phospholipase